METCAEYIAEKPAKTRAIRKIYAEWRAHMRREAMCDATIHLVQ
jgi:hypothetical protein